MGREIPTAFSWGQDTGSIIVVVATDAPLLPHQLKRLARRVTLGNFLFNVSVTGNFMIDQAWVQ